MSIYRVRAASALIVAAMVTLFLPAPVAQALSCAGDAPASPYAFRGVVERVEHAGQLAHVRTDDGRQVVIDARSGKGGAEVAWEVRYQAGQRYEFHPGNATSPYTDGLCSRSRLLVSETLPAGGTRIAELAVDTAPTAPPSPYSAALVLLAALIGVLLVGAAAWLWRRQKPA